MPYSRRELRRMREKQRREDSLTCLETMFSCMSDAGYESLFGLAQGRFEPLMALFKRISMMQEDVTVASMRRMISINSVPPFLSSGYAIQLYGTSPAELKQ